MIEEDDSEETVIIRVEKDVIRKKVTGQDVEKWEVAMLDCYIEPRSKPSEVIERLEERRKIRHENLMQQLAKNLHKVNLKTEKNIKISSMELKAHFKDFKHIMNETLSVENLEMVSHNATAFTDLQRKANEYKLEQQLLVDELHNDLIKFENERAKENEKILSAACEEMRKIGYFLPYEVQMFVEHETLKMNKLSLNNRRCYEDLRLTLTLVTEQTFRSYKDKVYRIWEFCNQRKPLDTFSLRLTPSDKKIQRTSQISQMYVRFEVKGHELNLPKRPHKSLSTCSSEEWLENVARALEALNAYGDSMVHICKKILNAIYDGFDADSDEISEEINSIESSVIEERVMKPIVFKAVSASGAKDLEEMELYWQSSLPEIQLHLSTMMTFIRDARKLWNRHEERVCESKKLILKALEKADSNNQATLQDLEIKLNMNIDALRQEHNEEKLQKAYEAVVATLNSIKAKYESMYLEDVSTVEDFYKMMQLEEDVLVVDIKEFIYDKYPLDVSKIIHQRNDSNHFFFDGHPIIKDIGTCLFKVHGIKSWKQGIWVALEILSGKIKEILAPRTERWISKKIENLAEQKCVQLELLDKRYQRVWIEIYEKRLSEINSHSQLLKHHKEKVMFVLGKIEEEFQNITARESDKIGFVKENLNVIEEHVLLENLPGVIRGNQMMLERKKEELENGLKMVFERFRAECNSRIFDLQQANIRFMKSIKLFHEGGDYSSEEAKMYVGKLETFDKELNVDLKNLLKDLAKEESDVLKRAAAIFNPVIALFGTLYEETFFHHQLEQRLRNFVEEIREITSTLKLDFEFLTDQCRCLCKSIKTTVDYDSEVKFWNFVIELLYRNVSHLLYPLNIPETEDSSITDGEKQESRNGESSSNCCCVGKFSDRLTTTSRTVFSRSATKGKPFGCKDYRSELFNCSEPPENDGTFMAVMCNNFWEEMDFLQRAACDFYKKIQGRKIIREDLIPSNYDAFIAEILTKFKYYYMQLKQFWFQIISDLMPLIGQIKFLANYFIESKLNDYKNVATKDLEDLEALFAGCIQTQSRENNQELQDLDKKLLPLHGHPHNAGLLRALEDEVVRKTANQKMQWETSIKKFKNELKCFRVRHILQKHELDKLEMIHKKLRAMIFVDDLGNNLLDEILRLCNKWRSTVKKNTKGNAPPEVDRDAESLASGEVPVNHRLDIIQPKKKFHTIETHIQKVKDIIDRERNTKPDTCPPCPEDSEQSYCGEEICNFFCQSKLNILLEIMDLESPIIIMLNDLDAYVRRLKAFANSQEKIFEEELYQWLEKWKYNVKRVLKLYSVGYEEKEGQPVEKIPTPTAEIDVCEKVENMTVFVFKYGK